MGWGCVRQLVRAGPSTCAQKAPRRRQITSGEQVKTGGISKRIGDSRSNDDGMRESARSQVEYVHQKTKPSSACGNTDMAADIDRIG